MQSELSQFIRSHRRNYPRGVPKDVSGIARVAFFSPVPLSTADLDVVRAAAEKGLKLASSEYSISVEAEPSPAHALIVFGVLDAPWVKRYPTVIQVDAVSRIAELPEVKRAFWDSIKVLQKR